MGQTPDLETEQQEVADNDRHPDCEMPYCIGSPENDTQKVKDPSENIITMCKPCYNSEWGMVVEKIKN